jgi:hypothetical protein
VCCAAVVLVARQEPEPRYGVHISLLLLFHHIQGELREWQILNTIGVPESMFYGMTIPSKYHFLALV